METENQKRDIFITKGTTNWLFIVVVALVAGAVGGALTIYINDTIRQTDSLSQTAILNRPQTQPSQGDIPAGTLEALKNMSIDGSKLNNGQYLSDIIDCAGVRGTCNQGGRFYWGLDANNALFGDFNNDGTQEAVVGIRGGSVDGKDDLAKALTDPGVDFEYLVLVKTVDGQLQIVDRMDSPTDFSDIWQRINSITVNNGQFTADISEGINCGDSKGIQNIKRTYKINILDDKFNILGITPSASDLTHGNGVCAGLKTCSEVCANKGYSSAVCNGFQFGPNEIDCPNGYTDSYESTSDCINFKLIPNQGEACCCK